ncbi:MAG: AAA family ATPase [Tepidisphaeraceae bacterium]
MEFDAEIGGEAGATKAAVEELVAKTPFMDATDVVGGPMLVRMADVESREVRWLWRGRIPLGRITLLVGRPGEGKSFFTMDAASRVSTGSPWPDDAPCERGSVLIISGEDDPADTIRPRLDAHHADVLRVHLLSMVRRIGEDGKPFEVIFSLHDLLALEAALQRIPDCKLIVIDPIGSFLGGDVDAHRDNEVRSILAPVAKLAEKYGPAVLVVAHRRKSAGSIADDLALGSRAFTGIARAVWHLTRDSENKARRLLLPGKNNLAREGNGLAFTIAGDPPAIAWERDPVQMSADDALAIENDDRKEDAKPGPEPQARKAAEDWLRKLLATGEVPAAKVKAEAKAAGMIYRTVQRAAVALGVIHEKNSFDGGWQWRFPKPGTVASDGDKST